MRVAILSWIPNYVITEDGQVQGPSGSWLSPWEDKANGHPDYYPWYVVGRPDEHRMNALQLVVKE